ncbi:DUF1616 domain-containing protein [archaeon]|jgi:uncharacterized membrane protein|nr:DUF1616 domain-containing protein [archaeon]
MKEEILYNILMGITLIAIITVIILIFTTKTTESFTELYFEDHENLPSNIQLNKDYHFQFSIHNLENQQIAYNYTIYIEYYTNEKLQYTETINSDSIILEHDQIATISESFEINEDFEQIKIGIETNDQEIHFWVEEEE